MTTSINYDMSKSSPRDFIIILLDKYDLTTTKAEMQKAKVLWLQGLDFREIGEILRPTPRGELETFILLLHMADIGMIERREGYMWGNMKEDK